ncbi:zincin [Hesseltinella vesiculosa]|uniref:mitochondrial intermediate peptidase n=1 Tax=Hesseltinella vesiculosa TaxID=101127 RepID=A0A1X2GDJ9_9FUNG|nr:zincin [Hesseltinella vesiculosa]
MRRALSSHMKRWVTRSTRSLALPPTQRALFHTSFKAASTADDSQYLRALFDDSALWRQHQQRAVLSNDSPTGLLEHPLFNNAAGFDKAAQQAINQAQILVERICQAPEHGRQEMKLVIQHLDKLSDTLCIVIDLAEFLRNAHPDPALMNAANKAYTDLCTYMNTLNTDTRLYKVLAKVLDDSTIVSQFTPDEHAAAIVFLRDFEKSGIHLPDAQRQQFVELSDRIILLGREFIQRQPRAASHIQLARSQLQGLPSSFLAQVSNGDVVDLATDSIDCQWILKYADQPGIRRQVYEAINSANPDSIELLEWLMRTRAELANLVGQPSYAHLQLQDKMAKNPDNVSIFLRTLLQHQLPITENDMRLLQQSGNTTTVNAWDRDYYMHKHTLTQPKSTSMPYFTVGSVIQGLSRLFDHLYGVHFEPADMRPGETWHEDVRKLDVVCERDGKIGSIYCDLYGRQSKTTHAAHYTIRTSRRLGPGQYQLPAIVLTCDFTGGNHSSVLSMFEVETLSHEMGHAMHSMLGRTDFHNVSGTRCATDFVELPSILMERFVSHPDVLALFTDRQDIKSSLQSYLQQRQRFSGIEINNQILMSMIDQQYHAAHTSAFVHGSFSSVQLWHQLQDKYGSFASVPGTMWPVQFGHLFGYGAGYYSYLFDRTLANRIWNTCFAQSPLDRENGQAFRDRLLQWGGSRDPWESVAHVLGGKDGDLIALGDEKAMSTVGDWGIDV